MPEICPRPRCDRHLPVDPERACACGGCRACGTLDAAVKGRCRPCYRYRRRTGRDRSPEQLERHRRRVYERHLMGELLREVVQASTT